MIRNIRKRFLILPVILLSVAGTIAFTSPGERYFEITKNLEIFSSLFGEVNALYVDDVNPTKMIEAGIEAMLKSLDPYTNYIPEDKVEDFRTLTRGHYGGIGSIIGRRDGKTFILMPYESSPAYASGLRIGDVLMKVDDIDVTEKNTEEISKLLKGQAGTEVKVTIERYGQEELVDIIIKRERINLDNVPYVGMITDDIGYFSLTSFSRNAGDEVRSAVKELKSQGAKKIIFDLRGNSGGLLDEAIYISNTFIPKKKLVVSTKGKSSQWNKEYYARNEPLDLDIPLVVLTDNGSASASEIVSGTMQDYDRGVLIGQKTFGKGLVQATRKLKYNAQVKVTTAKYYIPSGRCIQAIDYSHRNDDGSIGAIPDSLKTAFTTKNGRTVYDGGGVTPDIEMEERILAPMTQHLIKDSHLFDYATKYFYEHDEIAAAREFRLTDEEYMDFVRWMEDRDQDYKSKTEELIEELEEVARKEKCTTCVEKDLKHLRETIVRKKEAAIMNHKEEIREFLEREIVKRYYLVKGETEVAFGNDPDVLKAIEVLNDPKTYQDILTGGHN